jgi:hypothetical protein
MAGRKPKRSIASVRSLRCKRRDGARPIYLRAAPLPGTGRQKVLTRKTMAACALAASLSGVGASEAAAAACEAFRVTEGGRLIALGASESARLTAEHGIRANASGTRSSSFFAWIFFESSQCPHTRPIPVCPRTHLPQRTRLPPNLCLRRELRLALI